MARKASDQGSKSTKEKAPRRRLGRGLQSLMSTGPVEIPPPESAPAPAAPPKSASPEPAPAQPDAAVEVKQAPAAVAPPAAPDDSSGDHQVRLLSMSSVAPNPGQPRRDFDEQAIKHLASSIKSAGMMQPIVVRPAGDRFEIIAGERRWRATRELGLDRIPAIVREVDDRTAAEWALVENLQREDLNPLERAEAFRRLIHEFGITHQEVAETVGLDRSSVTNHLRLLELDVETRELVRTGVLTMGHGRCLLGMAGITARQDLAKAAVKQEWSVRELERRIRQAREKPAAGASAAASDDALKTDPVRLHMQDLEQKLGEHLGTKVAIQSGGGRKGSGRLVLSFYDLDQFEGLLDRLGYRER